MSVLEPEKRGGAEYPSEGRSRVAILLASVAPLDYTTNLQHRLLPAYKTLTCEGPSCTLPCLPPKLHPPSPPKLPLIENCWVCEWKRKRSGESNTRMIMMLALVAAADT